MWHIGLPRAKDEMNEMTGPPVHANGADRSEEEEFAGQT
jgi:hypothetical protein